MLKSLFVRLLIGGGIIVGGAQIAKLEPLRIFDTIIPYEKLQKLTHEIILEDWPNPDLWQNEASWWDR